MYIKGLMTIAVTTAVVFGMDGSALADGPAPYKITVSGMHCGGCAQKVAAKLGVVTHVAQVQTDFPSATFAVTPGPQKAPSPRALWEAVEKAGFKPTKLLTPEGRYTAKPKA